MIEPLGYHVLVRPDNVAERQGTIFLPTGAREREQMAKVLGTIVAIGDMAWQDMGAGKPWAKVGERVCYAKYGGAVQEDPETGEFYRILLDKDIVARVTGEEKRKKEAV